MARKIIEEEELEEKLVNFLDKNETFLDKVQALNHF